MGEPPSLQTISWTQSWSLSHTAIIGSGHVFAYLLPDYHQSPQDIRSRWDLHKALFLFIWDLVRLRTWHVSLVVCGLFLSLCELVFVIISWGTTWLELINCCCCLHVNCMLPEGRLHYVFILFYICIYHPVFAFYHGLFLLSFPTPASYDQILTCPFSNHIPSSQEQQKHLNFWVFCTLFLFLSSQWHLLLSSRKKKVWPIVAAVWSLSVFALSIYDWDCSLWKHIYAIIKSHSI